MIMQSHKDGLVLFIMMLLGISAATYHGKKTERATCNELEPKRREIKGSMPTYIVVQVLHLQIGFQARKAGISNVGTVEER